MKNAAPSPAELDPNVRRLQIAELAVTRRPRLFALHGIDAVTEREILGWGMDFAPSRKALLYLPNDSVTYYSDSAERAAHRYAMTGDIELTWL